MSEVHPWQYLTVQAFLERYNWSGQSSALPAVPSYPPEAKETVSWQRQRVQTFFHHFNWTGKPVEQPTEIPASPVFSSRMKVKDFLQCFVWEGQPNIAAVPSIPQLSPISDEDDLDLNDFSNMF